jgi:hypothetical protein
MLPAKYGDALLVTWGHGDVVHRMLIDAGLSSAFPAVSERLREIDDDIDLFVVSHVDTDHIGGAVKLLRDDTLAARVRAVWFNGHRHLEKFNDLLGPLDGERLTHLIASRALRWNEGWPDPVDGIVGGPIVCRGVPPVVVLPGGATVTVVGPSPQKLADLLPKWREVIERAGLVEGVQPSEDPPAPGRGMLGASLDDLALARFERDDAEANGSSIAFVFEFEGRRILFAADAHEETLMHSLAALAPDGARYHVDACKLPHHGSRRNVSKAFVEALECDQWWFSTSGGRFHHPNDEAIARVVRFGRPHPRLVGNYRSERWAAFTEAFPPSDHDYELVLPEEGHEGITISFR